MQLSFNQFELSPKNQNKSISTDDGEKEDFLKPKKVKTNICKYKTEICKNFSEIGYCPYREKCQFAHGYEEITYKEKKPRQYYRTKKCKQFWEKGVCSYGSRCQFSHYESQNKKMSPFLKIMRGLFSEKAQETKSKLLDLLENQQQ